MFTLGLKSRVNDILVHGLSQYGQPLKSFFSKIIFPSELTHMLMHDITISIVIKQVATHKQGASWICNQQRNKYYRALHVRGY